MTLNSITEANTLGPSSSCPPLRGVPAQLEWVPVSLTQEICDVRTGTRCLLFPRWTVWQIIFCNQIGFMLVLRYDLLIGEVFWTRILLNWRGVREFSYRQIAGEIRPGPEHQGVCFRGHHWKADILVAWSRPNFPYMPVTKLSLKCLWTPLQLNKILVKIALQSTDHRPDIITKWNCIVLCSLWSIPGVCPWPSTEYLRGVYLAPWGLPLAFLFDRGICPLIKTIKNLLQLLTNSWMQLR